MTSISTDNELEQLSQQTLGEIDPLRLDVVQLRGQLAKQMNKRS